MKRRKAPNPSSEQTSAPSKTSNDSKLPIKNSLSKKNQAVVSLSLSHVLWISTLIFGGCCSNVITLETIIQEKPGSGKLLTFVQFLLVAIEGVFHFFDAKSPFLIRPPQIPLHRWVLPVALYFAVSVLNNAVWDYDISVPVHIIFRSGGTLMTMLVGFLFMHKRYNPGQVIAVLVLTVGVMITTWSNGGGGANEAAVSVEMETVYRGLVDSKFLQGIGLLLLAAFLTAFQGLISEQTYARYGKHWRENLFYSHFFALFLFIPFWGQISDQWRQILVVSSRNPLLFGIVPKLLVMLFLNAVTQYVCVRGVHNLAGHSSALTVTIFLNIRKFVSLVLSAWFFGNSFDTNGMIGVGLVFCGAVLYSAN